jgi:hypothetical protein
MSQSWETGSSTMLMTDGMSFTPSSHSSGYLAPLAQKYPAWM